MTSKSKVYVAGIGYSPSPSNGSAKASVASLISAATKALLDAGVTYDDVAQGVTTARSQGSETFKAFDEGGVEVDEVENGSEIKASYKFIEDRGIRCVLTIVVEKVRSFILGELDGMSSLLPRQSINAWLTNKISPRQSHLSLCPALSYGVTHTCRTQQH